MSAYPGFYAVPGSMEPGAIWPGDPGPLPSATPAIAFALGTPYFRWATGEPDCRWATGEPYLS